MFDLEKALASWRRQFRYHRLFQQDDVDELERHLRDQIHHLVRAGRSEKDAFREAVQEMGSFVEAEPEYRKNYWLKRKHERTVLREVRWRLTMAMNYLKLGYRTLLKNKVSSAINIVGLSIAVGCCIVVYLFLNNYLRMDRAHVQGDRIFVVEHTVERDHAAQTWGTSPMPLGPALAHDFPQIERVVRINRVGATVQYEEHLFEEGITFVDEGFFEMFTFPLAAGTPAALHDPNAVILSDATAAKYFGDANPLGRQLTIWLGDDRPLTFTVRGVAEAFPPTAGFQFQFLINYDKQRDFGVETLDDWSRFTDATFIQLHHPRNIDGIAGQMGRYVPLQNAANEEWTILSFVFDNFRHPASNAYLVRDRFAEAPHPIFMLMLAAIPLCMLALSCFNYVNISLGASARRLREIGVRKAMGGTKTQLIAQFMAENLLLCLLSLLVGLGIAQGFLIPLFNAIFVNLIELSFTDNFGLWLFLIGLLAFVGIASGAYPAFYVASFQPVAILRGTLTLARKKWMTRAFLTLQFVLTFFTVITSLYLSLNEKYLLKQDWGYNPDHTLVVRLQQSDQYALLRDEILQLPNVVSVTGAQHHIGKRGMGEAVVTVAGIQKNMRYFGVGPSYLDAMGMRLVSGRLFDERLAGDGANAVVINRAFAEQEGWDDPINQTIRVQGTSYTVIGVVDNFLVMPLLDSWPLFFLPVDETRYAYLAVDVAPGGEAQTAAAVEDIWKRLIPGTPFNYFFQTDVFAIDFESYSNLAQAFSYIAALALLISCMGLYGLASQNIARRMKEVSIRKVLGASASHLSVLVNRGFILMLTVAALIATSVFYGGMTALFNAFDPVHMPLGPGLFGLSYVLVFTTAALAVAMQVRKLVSANPAEVLRTD